VFAWEAINELIDENHITSENFHPLSHLVLQFIHGDFHIAKAENQDIKHIDANSFDGPIDRSSSWLPYALMHLLKLTLSLVMATTTNAETTMTISLPKWHHDTEVKRDGAQVDEEERNRIVYKVSDEEAHSRSMNPEQAYLATHIELRPVSNLSLDEMETYWLKACKLISSLVDANTNLSSRAVFCLNALIEAGKDSALPSRIWSALLIDLIDKLPLTISRAPIKSSSTSDDDRDGMCLQCCNLIFDLIVNHVRELQQNTDFTSIWLKFIRTLTSNLVLLGDQAGSIHSKMMEMIVTSLKLLVSAINIRLIKSTNAGKHGGESSSIHDAGNLANSAPAPEGLFQFVTELLGFSGSPMPEPAPSSTMQETVSSVKSTPIPKPTHAGPVPELTAKAIDLSQSSRFSTPTKPSSSKEAMIPTSSNSNRSDTNHQVDSMAIALDSDQTLLNLTWKTIISNYHDFPAHLRSIYPHLMDELDKLILASHDASTSASASEVSSTSI
jgi:hypothetical protein